MCVEEWQPLYKPTQPALVEMLHGQLIARFRTEDQSDRYSVEKQLSRIKIKRLPYGVVISQ